MRVVIAHEAEAIRESALRVVREAGYDAIAVADGESALALVLETSPRPAALVVDVGLPKRLGYEIVEEIRARELPIKVVLIASVYSKTAYKRTPTRLYGADDYVEQHHIPDKLASKLALLLPTSKTPAPKDVHDWARLTDEERAEVEQIRRAGEARLFFGDLSPKDAVTKARRMARVIVADVLLYDGAAVEEGLARGDLAARLAKDLQAGRDMFAQHVPGHIRQLAGDHDFIRDALEDFIASLAKNKDGRA